jgi:Flp pilus assembly protein TadD
MAGCPQLDVARRARIKRVIARLALLLSLLWTLNLSLLAQDSLPDAGRLAAARAAFDASRWEEAAKLAQGPSEQSPDLDFVAGLAFARLERWKDARNALETGHRKSPNDPRFLVELAGVSYKQKEFGIAKRDLRAALPLDPRDTYTQEFLGTLYFLEGNLEAAVASRRASPVAKNTARIPGACRRFQRPAGAHQRCARRHKSQAG